MTIPRADKNGVQLKVSYTTGGNANGTDTLPTVCQFLRKLNRCLPYKPAILLLQIYPREIKTSVHTKI